MRHNWGTYKTVILFCAKDSRAEYEGAIDGAKGRGI